MKTLGIPKYWRGSSTIFWTALKLALEELRLSSSMEGFLKQASASEEIQGDSLFVTAMEELSAAAEAYEKAGLVEKASQVTEVMIALDGKKDKKPENKQEKKGWFGVERNKEWGSGSKHFLRELFEKKHGGYKNFFNDILEPLFYEALRLERHGDYYSRFDNIFTGPGIVENGMIEPLPREQSIDDLAESLLICTPAEMIDKLGPYNEIGIDRVILNVNFGLSQAETLECLQCFAEEIMPQFSQRKPTPSTEAAE